MEAAESASVWCTDLEIAKAAPYEEHLLLMLTGDPLEPFVRVIGYWDPEEHRWNGRWRYLKKAGQPPYPFSEPIAFAMLPEIDISIREQYEVPVLLPMPKAS